MSRRIMTLCPPKEGLKNDMSTRMIICPPKTRYAHQDDNIPTKKIICLVGLWYIHEKENMSTKDKNMICWPGWHYAHQKEDTSIKDKKMICPPPWWKYAHHDDTKVRLNATAPEVLVRPPTQNALVTPTPAISSLSCSSCLFIKNKYPRSTLHNVHFG